MISIRPGNIVLLTRLCGHHQKWAGHGFGLTSQFQGADPSTITSVPGLGTRLVPRAPLAEKHTWREFVCANEIETISTCTKFVSWESTFR